MEIYKLGDEVGEGGEVGGAKFEVTELKQGVKNTERVNVFIDGKYEFSLFVSQVVEFGLKKGMKLSAEQVTEYKKASEYGKLYQRALEWVLLRPRSEREVRDYLRRKIQTLHLGHTQGRHPRPEGRTAKLTVQDEAFGFSNDIISRLKAKGYLDDERFAEWYVENRFVKKGVARKRLMMELAKKGIKREMAEVALEKVGRDDEEEIKKIVAKKRTKYDDEKLISYLVRQGFDYQLAQTVVRESQSEMD